jgi:hypothetical protein
VGGGVYLGCLYSNEPPSSVVQGNAIYDNIAEVRAGGVFFAASPAEDQALLASNNTVVRNCLVNTTTGQGVGMFIGIPNFAFPPNIEAASNIVHVNVVSPNTRDWFVECGATDLTWTYSQLPNWGPSCLLLPPNNSENLYTLPGASQNNDASPLVALAGLPKIDNLASPCIDTGDPAATGVVLAEDFEDESRIQGTAIDRGGDEFTQVQFTRGNANGDPLNQIDISDALFMLTALFVSGSPQPVCLDTADVNDSGSFNIADPQYLLAFLFGGGAPPPAPFSSCGYDPTFDSLVVCTVPVGCP